MNAKHQPGSEAVAHLGGIPVVWARELGAKHARPTTAAPHGADAWTPPWGVIGGAHGERRRSVGGDERVRGARCMLRCV